MNYLEEWATSIIKKPSAKLKEPVEVDGLRDAHLGPRWEYAKVRMRIEPSDGFDVRFEISQNMSTKQSTYLDAAIMGLLDVILLAESSPLIDIRVIVIGLEEHEVDSSPRAFRMAGRDAGQNLLRTARDRALTSPR
jgi:hypothetical protein